MRSPTTITVALLSLVAVSTLGAVEVPEQINYQGRLLDSGGQPLASGFYTMRFSIFSVPESGTAIWGPQEFLAGNEVWVQDGYFNVILGPQDASGRSIVEPFTAAGQQLGPRYLSITVDGAEILPRQQVLSAPFTVTAGQLVGQVFTDSTSNGFGRLQTYGPGGTVQTKLGQSDDRGAIFVNDATGSSRAILTTNANGVGYLRATSSTGGSIEVVGADSPAVRADGTAGYASLTASGSPVLELRSKGGGTAAVDFSNDNTANDYDARIQLTGDNELKVLGASFTTDQYYKSPNRTNSNAAGDAYSLGVHSFCALRLVQCTEGNADGTNHYCAVDGSPGANWVLYTRGGSVSCTCAAICF